MLFDKDVWKLDYKVDWLNSVNLFFNGIYRCIIGFWLISMLVGLLLYKLGLWVFKIMEDIWGKRKNKKNKDIWSG